MKIFFRSLLLLVLIAILGSLMAYPMYKDALYNEARIYLSQTISDHTEYAIDIGELNFSYLFVLNLNKVRVGKKNSTIPSFVNINNVQISCNLFKLIKNKQLETTIKLQGIEKDGYISNALIKTFSDRSHDYKTIFSPELVKDISVIDAKLSSKNFNFNKINGKISFNNCLFSEAKISFGFKENLYLIKFRPSPGAADNYEISILSDNINLIGLMAKVNSESFLIKYLTGQIYALNLDLSGYIKGLSVTSMDMALKGEARTDLSKLHELPGKIGQAIKKINISGTVESKVNFTCSDPSFKKYDLDASFSSGLMTIDKVNLTKADARLVIKDGRLNIPSITSSFYGGKIYGDAKIDIQEPDLPYIISFSIDNMFLDEFIEDLSGGFSPVYGNTFAKLFLKGYALDDTTMEGTLELEVSDGDLGPMPLVAPLLGDIYSMLRNSIIAPENRVNISQAYGEFIIKDRKISTDNFSLWGENIAIIGTGNMDFHGNLDFIMENKFTQSPIKEAQNWQTAIRNSIIRLGKALGKAHLKGTLSKPKWEFDYFVDK